ncbi:MAG TPA: tripartite tricarboxylate transporter substrate binding protein [Ramlibacter sp.]|nr:tripartite tricarboxylate transporter substrate binding protein [Ramlibacter sp.]
MYHPRILVAALALAACAAAHAFPTKPITIIVPFNAGTTNDINARDFAQVLSAVAKQPVVVDNRVGAEGTIGAQAMLNAPADGHTMVFSSNSLTVYDPLLKKNIPYDPAKDLLPVCGAGRTSLLVNVTASGPVKSVAELVAAAKAQPGKLTYAYTSSSMRLAGELFQQVTGTRMTSVPYKSSVTALTDLSSGQVDAIFIDRPSAAAFHESGKVRALAVAGSKRLKSVPNVPTTAEAGLPAFTVQPWFGLYISGKTPPAVQAQVRELIERAIKTPEMAANQDKRNLDAFDQCGDALVKYRQQETDALREVVRKAGIERE